MSEVDKDRDSDIKARVYHRQVHLLYSNQYLAVSTTILVVAVLFGFLQMTIVHSKLAPWALMFAALMSLRILVTFVYCRMHLRHKINYYIAEKIYCAGVVATGMLWGAMLIVLLPDASLSGQILLLLVVIGVVAASHTTMGYRKLPYYLYTLFISLSLIYAVYVSDLPNAAALALAVLVHMIFALRSGTLFCNSFEQMMYLQEQLIDREHTLLMQREQANLASQAKSEFLSRMSHELRTPLNAVLGLNELQMRDRRNPLTDFQYDRASKINDAGTHLLSLVNDVLDLSRIEAGSMKIELKPVDCQMDIRDALKLVETKAHERDITLAFEASLEPVWVMAEPRRLKQVIVNLLDNAIKYNRRGGMVTVMLSAGSEKDTWRISFIDTGYGISEEGIDELFTPFKRLDESKHRVDGVGIGLSFSKQLVELMHGKIGVDSRYGEGSCFWVELLAAEPEITSYEDVVAVQSPVEHPAARGDHQPESGSKKLLLVEDNMINQEVAMDMLQDMGLEVDVANNGEEALARLSEHHYAIILMDCEMPVMDGLTATRKLRSIEQQEDRRPTPVIALTAHAIHGAKEKCLASGMDDFLSKPFSYTVLKNLLIKWNALSDTAPSSEAEPMRVVGDAEETGDSVNLDVTALERLRTRKSSLVEKVVNLYIEQTPQVLDDIAQAADLQNYEQLSNLAHTFKSSSLTVGATEVANSCRKIEASADAGDIDIAIIEQMREQFSQVRCELERYIGIA